MKNGRMRLLGVLGMLILVFSVVTPAFLPAAPAQGLAGTRITGWTAKSGRVAAGVDRVKTIRVRSGKSFTPRTVVVQRRPSGSTKWVTIGQGTTSKRGYFRVNMVAPAPGKWKFRVVVPASRTAGRRVTSTRVLTAYLGGQTRIEGWSTEPADVTSTSVTAQIRVITGSGYAKRKVIAQYRRVGEGTWTDATSFQTDDGGSFLWLSTPPSSGTWEARIVVPATKEASAAETAPRQLVRREVDTVSNLSATADASLVAYDVIPIGQSTPSVRVKGMTSGQVTVVSTNPAGEPANGAAAGTSISPDGRFVAFWSDATNITADSDLNYSQDLFLKDLQTGQVRKIVTGPWGTTYGGQGWPWQGGWAPAAFSPDGARLAFSANRRLYVADVATGQTVEVASTNCGMAPPMWSPDGTTLLAHASQYPAAQPLGHTAFYYGVVISVDVATHQAQIASVDVNGAYPFTENWYLNGAYPLGVLPDRRILFFNDDGVYLKSMTDGSLSVVAGRQQFGARAAAGSFFALLTSAELSVTDLRDGVTQRSAGDWNHHMLTGQALAANGKALALHHMDYTSMVSGTRVIRLPEWTTLEYPGLGSPLLTPDGGHLVGVLEGQVTSYGL